MAQALLFLGIAMSMLGIIHYYLWRRLVRSTTRTRRGRRIGTLVLVGAAGLVLVAFVGNRALPRFMETILAWPAYLWLAVMFYLLVLLALLELPALVARVVIRRTARSATVATAPQPALVGVGAVPEDRPPATGIGQTAGEGPGESAGASPPESAGESAADSPVASRRLFLARTVAITAGVAALGLVGSGVRSALGPPQVKRVQIPLARLGRGADGMRIALVSDIHLGPLTGVEHTRRVVDLVNGLSADAVAIVGDLVDGSVEELGSAVAPLRDLRGRHGAYFVTGNHEYFSGYEAWVEELPRLGLRLLRNERIELPGGLDFAGVNDINGESFGDGPDVARALAGRDADRVVVLLAHQPAMAAEAAEHGVDLQLSGHTHGGQIVPFNLVVRLSGQPVVSGLGEVAGMPVYVTNGAGFWGPPVRVGASPDITLVELRAGR